ncbi:N-acetylmuramoyl-L-alanine amidase [Oxynema sp. CENA135]|uniref:N-acetylmuramoyl-L-alanine amidase n=1 Tax=Oxynema sp. CENA135 TaxID=984206 RepID=UPI00351C0093
MTGPAQPESEPRPGKRQSHQVVRTDSRLLDIKTVTRGIGLLNTHNQLRKTGIVARWLLPGLVGAFLMATPAEAARLLSWRFDADSDRLSFTTASGVQPQAQLLANPTRLAIDLPGTTLGRPSFSESVGGNIREIRVGQFNPNTTRIVVELAHGYTLDPRQVQFQGISPSQWTVQLPEPQRLNEIPTASTTEGHSGTAIAANNGAPTLLEGIEITDDGFVLQTRGEKPQFNLNARGDRNWISLDLPGVAVSSELSPRLLNVDRWGVDRVQVMEVTSSPQPLTRIILSLNENASDWQVRSNDSGAIALWPKGSPPPSLTAANREPVTVNAIELKNNGTELLIDADGPISYENGWDPETSAYKLTLYSARLGDGVKVTRPENNPSVLWIKATQQDAQTVVIRLLPGAGVQIGQVEQGNNSQQLALSLQPNRMTSQGDNVAIAVPSPNNSAPLPVPNNTPAPTPRPTNGRMVVVIDAGHGGGDPGAIGIGGLREKDVVIDISRQVAQILEQNGVSAIMSRNDDREIDLAPRTQLANRINANLFVSIHANAINMSRPDVNGIETYYYESGRRLADYIHSSILNSLNVNDRGVRRARFYVLRHTRMPAVLVETGFVTGRDDARMLADSGERSRMAEAIARGILNYIRDNG